MFGEFDPVNMEWKDGVISSVFRRFCDRKAKDTLKWIIFDGPVYTEWIENLNTVLDDNRKLCLSSGEVLNLPENSLILFEVEDLSHASPSTVKFILCIFGYFKRIPQIYVQFCSFCLDFTSWDGLF